MSRFRLIDIGANLTDPMFVGMYNGKKKHISDFEHILSRAFANNVEKIIVTSGSLSDSKEALALARQHSNLYSTLGVHPTRCNEFLEDPDAYMEQLHQVFLVDSKADKKIVAIGEFGLDYDRLEFCDKETQKTYFQRQFELARTSKLPLFLHNRNTGTDFYDMIRRNRDAFKDGVVHSFTGTMEEAKQLLDLGLYIGINGCSMKTVENLDVVKMIPRERLMLETDAPWCDIRSTHAGFSHVQTTFMSKKPEKFVLGDLVKGRNEPCKMMQVLEVVSGIRGENATELADAVYENTCRVFF